MPSFLHPLLLLRWLLLIGVALTNMAWAAPVTLRDDQVSVDLWPAVTIYSDPARQLTWQQALGDKAKFSAPTGTRANLGPRKDAVWFYAAVQIPEGQSGAWVLDIDYPGLDRVDVHVLRNSELVSHAAMGRQVPHTQWPMRSRAPAMEVRLAAGASYELLIRVDTTSTLIAPMRFVKLDAFHSEEASNQVLQGVVAGMGLCLLLYSLLEWSGLRDRLFLYYALVMVGSICFFFAHFGLGAQHIWGASVWLTVNGSPFFAICGMVGAFLFVNHALRVHEINRWLGWAMQAGAIIAVLLIAGLVLGLISYRNISLLGSVLGPMPMFLAIPVAIVRARRGDRVAAYMLLGWSVYFAGAIIMVGLLRGLVPASAWTLHAFEFASMIEMVVWMRVLALRVEDVRSAAHRAHVERDRLRVLAHSDPLTGLLNRRGLTEAINLQLRHVSADRMLAIYLIDLDGFKAVNDRLGHAAGDSLLVEVANRLEQLVRSSDAVARLGGDEFVVMAAGVSSDAEADALGRKLLTGIEQPFQIDGNACQVGMTVGYALAPLDGMETASLMQRADSAMYEGKRAGRHCLKRVSSPQTPVLSEA